MKKILYIAAAAALLMTSCQKTDVLNVVEDTIEFGTEVGKLTKADANAAEDYSLEKYATLNAQGFRVWAVSDFNSGDIDKEGEIYRGLKNLPVINGQSTASGWGFDATKVTNKYLWPQSPNKLYFYTVSSAKAESWLVDGGNDPVTPKFLFNGGTAVTEVKFPLYTVDDTAHDDVMVADAVHQDKSQGKTVAPTFRHTMTKVMFNFKKGGPADNGAEEAENIVLKSITTTDLQYKGTLTFTYGNGKTGTPSAWAPEVVVKPFSKTAESTYKVGDVVIPKVANFDEVKNPVDGNYCLVGDKLYKYTSEGSWAQSDDTYTTIEGMELTENYQNFVTWYMIPQTLADADLNLPSEGEQDRTLSGAVVTIIYEADGKKITQNFDLNVSESAKDWSEEHCVKYNVTIAPHKIQFKPEVEEWDKVGEELEN